VNISCPRKTSENRVSDSPISARPSLRRLRLGWPIYAGLQRFNPKTWPISPNRLALKNKTTRPSFPSPIAREV
jgi:hypothetical protein